MTERDIKLAKKLKNWMDMDKLISALSPRIEVGEFARICKKAIALPYNIGEQLESRRFTQQDFLDLPEGTLVFVSENKNGTYVVLYNGAQYTLGRGYMEPIKKEEK